MKSLFSILGLLILTSCTTTNQGSGNSGSGGDGGNGGDTSLTPTAFLRGIVNFDVVNDINQTVTRDPILGIPGVTQTRIPAVVQTKSGRILTMFDARSTSQADAANDIDTGIRASDDNGKTWNVGKLVNYYDDYALEDAASQGRKQDSASFIDSAPVVAANGDIVSITTLFPAGSGIQGGARHPAANPFIRKNGTTYIRLVKKEDATYPGSSADDPTKYLYEAPAKGGPITKIADGSATGYTIDKYWYISLNGTPVEIDQRNSRTPKKIRANVAFADSPFRNVRSSYIAFNRSTDNGATWGTPIDISQQFRPERDNQHYIVSPGVGHVVKEGPNAGRIVYVLYETPGNSSAPSNPNTGSSCNAFSIYSDDNGTTWKQGGYTKPAPGLSRVSESQIVEAPGGQLLMYSRGGTRISLSHSVDGGVTWTDSVNTEMYNGQSSGTQFGVQTLYKTSGADGQRLAVMIHPNHGSSRRDGTVRTGEFTKSGQKVPGSNEDEWIVDWDTTSSAYAFVMPIAPSADNFGYSSIVELQDGNLGIFFEGVNNYQTGKGELNFGIVKLDRVPL